LLLISLAHLSAGVEQTSEGLRIQLKSPASALLGCSLRRPIDDLQPADFEALLPHCAVRIYGNRQRRIHLNRFPIRTGELVSALSQELPVFGDGKSAVTREERPIRSIHLEVASAAQCQVSRAPCRTQFALRRVGPVALDYRTEGLCDPGAIVLRGRRLLG
jgi:hypothetical protein